MTVSAKQNWTASGSTTAVATRDLVLVSVPVAGNLMVCYAERGAGTGTMSIADTIGDGVAWTSLGSLANTTEGVTCQGWWKVVGTPSGGGKTVTVTNVTSNAPLQLVSAEYQSSVSGITWSLNGVFVSAKSGSASANPSPGGITVDATPSVVTGFVSTDNALSTAASGYTREAIAEFFGEDAVEDKFTAAAATETPSWTSASSNWVALGAAFKATPASGGSDVSSTGSAAATFGAQSSAKVAIAAAGVSTATLAGAAQTAVPMASAGISAAAFSAQTQAAAPLSSAGTASATFTAQESAAANIGAAGTATAVFAGTSGTSGSADLSMAGQASVAITGQASAAAAVSMAGASTVIFKGSTATASSDITRIWGRKFRKCREEDLICFVDALAPTLEAMANGRYVGKASLPLKPRGTIQ